MSEYGPEQISNTPILCEGCPAQHMAHMKLVELRKELGHSTTAAGRLIGESGEMLDRLIDATLPPETTKSEKIRIRQQAAYECNLLEDEIEQLKAAMGAVAASCDEPLKMRATTAGATYTVAICTSFRLLTGDSDQRLPGPAYINRQVN